MLATFLSYFATFVAFVAGITLVTEFINDVFKVSDKPLGKIITPKQLISWGVALAGAAIGFGCQLGFFADLGPVNSWQGWIMAMLTGLGAGFGANGLYDITGIQKILDFIFQFLKPKTKTINE